MMKPIVAILFSAAHMAGAGSGHGGSTAGLGELRTDIFEDVVVIPDVHGDPEAFLTCLYGVFNIIERSANPIELDAFKALFRDTVEQKPLKGVPLAKREGGQRRVALVQLGDVVDRGPRSIECIDIALKIESVIGWSVTILHGNHEIDRMLGEGSEYIHRDELERVGVEGMRGVVNERLADVGLVMARLTGSRDLRSEGPRNPNTLFVHAGVDLPWLRSVVDSNDVSKINEKFLKDVGNNETLNIWKARESLVWTRRYLKVTGKNYADDAYCQDILPGVLEHFNVARIIVGHMPQQPQMKTRCGGKIILTDIAMSAWMKTNPYAPEAPDPGALIMQIDELGALSSICEYRWRMNGWEKLRVTIWSDGRRLRGDSDDSGISIDLDEFVSKYRDVVFPPSGGED